jgi:hypothetical protein
MTRDMSTVETLEVPGHLTRNLCCPHPYRLPQRGRTVLALWYE